MATPDIIVTWPKTRPLQSYLTEIQRAHERGLVINFRVPTRPDVRPHRPGGGSRLYRVHDGEIRGWTPIVYVQWKMEGRVLDPATGSFMRAGYYIVCDPQWHRAAQCVPMKGFRGWRWFDRKLVGD